MMLKATCHSTRGPRENPSPQTLCPRDPWVPSAGHRAEPHPASWAHLGAEIPLSLPAGLTAAHAQVMGGHPVKAHSPLPPLSLPGPHPEASAGPPLCHLCGGLPAGAHGHHGIQGCPPVCRGEGLQEMRSEAMEGTERGASGRGMLPSKLDHTQRQPTV